MRWYHGLFGLCLVAGAFGLVELVKSAKPPRSGQRPVTPTALPTQRNEAALESAVTMAAMRNLDARLSSMESQRSAAPPARTERGSSDTVRHVVLSPAEVSERNNDWDQSLSTTLLDEPLDQAWAQETEGHLLKDAESVGLSEALRVECRQTLCRLSIPHSADLRDEFEDFVLSPRRRMGAQLIHLANESNAYFFRRGYDTRSRVMSARP